MRSGNLALAAALCLLAAPATAQDSAESLRAEMEALKLTLERLEARLKQVEAQDGAPAPAPAPVTEAAPDRVAVAEPEPETEVPGVDSTVLPDRETVSDPGTAASRLDSEAPPGNPELKGFFLLPNTDTRIRFGGYAKVDAIQDAHTVGDRESFTTSTIAINGPGDDSPNFNLHAQQTRFSFEARRPTSRGNLRFYLENDFYNSDYGYRLRHAYGQIGNTYAGFGYSAFMDADGSPETLDFAGPGSVPSLRLAAIQQTYGLGEGNTLRLSIEDSETELDAGAGGVRENGAPDVSVAGRIERNWGHLQLSGVLRRLAYRDLVLGRDTTVAGGLSFSGSTALGADDSLVFGANWGRGVARYLSDLSGGNLDAAVDANGDIEALQTQGAYVGYTHHWRAEWRSNLVYGYLAMEREQALLQADDFRRSQYAAFNLIWSPAPTWTMGMELLYGQLQQQDSQRGDALRLQTSLQYNFIK